ncbi:patatin, partial [Bacillus thuringiensis]
MTYPFRNLVFEGGGVKGVAFIGAIRALNDEEILPKIQRFGGTSAGAITALLLG